MRVQSNGKIRRTAAEREALLLAQRESGLSESAFCRRKKISKSTFSKWKKRQGRRASTPRARPAGRFVELSAPAPDEAGTPSGAQLVAGEFELRLPGGIVLRWRP